MRILRYRKVVQINVGFHVEYDLVPPTTLREDDVGKTIFDGVFEQIKLSGFDWDLREVTTTMVASSGGSMDFLKPAYQLLSKKA